MALFGGKRSNPDDPSLSDSAWLAAGRSRFDRAVSRYLGSPETIASGGFERLADPAAALFFLQKAIDLLHTNYGYMEMRQRQPGPDDDVILEGYVHILGSVRALRPVAPVADSIREVTHRLRSISSTCKQQDLSGQHYIAILNKISQVAPEVNVDDIYWDRINLLGSSYMTLVACRECIASISESAATCPQCGVSSPAGSASLTFARTNSLVNGAVAIEVLVDGKSFRVIRMRQRVSVPVTPGNHHVELRTNQGKATVGSVQAGSGDKELTVTLNMVGKPKMA